MTEVYGVFEGGGVRGSALVGAVAAAEEQQITFRAVAGTSAGAIVASLIAAGYEASEMQKLLTETNFENFRDAVSPAIHIPLLKWRSAFRHLGLYKGDAFHRWIGEQLSLKLTGRRHESIRFSDLPTPLTVIAADVIRQREEIFSSQDTPNIVVADAVRMSMSIPFFFCPVKFGGGLIVDGGVLSNFPAWVFDAAQGLDPLPILGFRLQQEDEPLPTIRNMWDLAKSLVTTVLKTNIRPQISHLSNLHTIELPTVGVKTTDFDISNEKKEELYSAGYRATLANLNVGMLAQREPDQEGE